MDDNYVKAEEIGKAKEIIAKLLDVLYTKVPHDELCTTHDCGGDGGQSVLPPHLQRAERFIRLPTEVYTSNTLTRKETINDDDEQE